MIAAKGHPAEQCAAPASTADADTLSTLFRQHHRLLVGYLTSRLQCEQEAKEVAQEAYVRLLESKVPIGPSLLRAYLFKIAANLSIDRLRHRQVRYRAEAMAQSTCEPFAHGDADDPAQQWLTRERMDQLAGYLRELPQACRQVIDLHRLQGLPQHKVATQLGFSERMVRRYLNYAMLYCRLRVEGIDADQVREKVTL